ncbi:MAG: PilN domain-containing protein [Candidatus Omnitrophica bacterium]|nr:PilN domain-containing protein [Candidatus Omnitrophota bacterium]
MLQINLLPDEFRTKKDTTGLNLERIVLVVSIVLSLVIFLHLVLGFIQISRIFQLKAVQQNLNALEPQRKQIEIQQKQQQDPARKMISDFLNNRILWSRKLNTISLQLPAGVWLNEMSMSNSELYLDGSVVSVSGQGNEIDLINRFMSALRSDKDFMKDFSALELGPLNSQIKGSFTVQDYSITIKAKQKSN